MREAAWLTKHVGGVVGHLVLKHGGDALHAHTGVHMLGWQALQAGVSFPVELQPSTTSKPKLVRGDI